MESNPHGPSKKEESGPLVRVRPARSDGSDDAAVGALLVASFNETYAEKMPEVVMFDRRRAELLDVASMRKHGEVWVAELDGRVVGSVTLFRSGSTMCKSWLTRACEMRFLAIAREYQGRDVGGRRLSSYLMDAALKRAREQSDMSFTLHVRRGAHGVARFYERYGFKRAPEGDRDLLPEVYLEGYLLEL